MKFEDVRKTGNKKGKKTGINSQNTRRNGKN